MYKFLKATDNIPVFLSNKFPNVVTSNHRTDKLKKGNLVSSFFILQTAYLNIDLTASQHIPATSFYFDTFISFSMLV